MRWMHAGLTAAVLFGAPVFADDAQQPATKTMREAMAGQASMPAAPHAKAGDPASEAGKPKADAQQTKAMKHSPSAPHSLPADQAAKQAHQHAGLDASTETDSMHAAMANRAAMSAMGATMGGASETCQGRSDCQNAAGTMRSTSPGTGLMGGSTSGGPTSGSAMPGSGTPGTTTGSGSMPMSGKR